MTTTTIHALNALSPQRFRDVLAGIFERSPWVPEAVEPARPFADLAALHAVMVEAVVKAPYEDKLSLLRAHPDLAGKEAQAGALTADSSKEQKSAGLDRLSRAEMDTISRNNEAYKKRFGFPFIICVRNHDKAGIFAAFERRLNNPAEAEFETALQEVYEIARLRLEMLLAQAQDRRHDA
jgi:2-oxo-4-hydroxy-4-carboxy-5-ureidoimidazoline decarboxylase